MAAEARSAGFSGVGSLGWGALAGFSGVTLAGIASGNNYGPFVTYAQVLEEFVIAHEDWALLSGGTGLLLGLMIGGVLDDEVAIEVLPLAVLSAGKKNSPLAGTLSDASFLVFTSYAALSAFAGLNAGLGTLYAAQAGACAFERVADGLQCKLGGNKEACKRVNEACQFGPSAPWFPSD